jgi:hypothetical protein
LRLRASRVGESNNEAAFCFRVWATRVAIEILLPDAVKEGRDTMMTLIREDEPFEMREERDNESAASNVPVSARVGQNKVEIDAEALKHLIDTLRAKLG